MSNALGTQHCLLREGHVRHPEIVCWVGAGGRQGAWRVCFLTMEYSVQRGILPDTTQ